MLKKITALASRFLHGAERHRAYTYRLAATVGALLVGSGQLTAGRESALLTLLGAVLGLGGSGLAAVNTSTQKRDSATQLHVHISAEDPGAAGAIHRALLEHKRRSGGKDLGLS